jgi:hypothetical protein
MYFKQIEVPGIGCLSYVISCPPLNSGGYCRKSAVTLISRTQGMKIPRYRNAQPADRERQSQIRSRPALISIFIKQRPSSSNIKPYKRGIV